MNNREILIGTGFYSTIENHDSKEQFYSDWMSNTLDANPAAVVVVDNSMTGLANPLGAQVIRIRNNLGHSANHALRGSKLMGWSMSWILPAMIAYSENLDFVYKEQDCLAFGDWTNHIRLGMICIGRHPTMPCEQSLFWMRRSFIPEFVAAYMEHPDPDNHTVTEDKMVQASRRFEGLVTFFAMPFGRLRPLTYHKDRPWYAQRFSSDEMADLRAQGFLS